MKKMLVILAGVLGLVAAAGCGDDTGARAAAIAMLTGDPAAGQTIYASTASPSCLSCHRDDGMGTGMYPSIHEAARTETVEVLAGKILRGQDLMPAYADQLSDQQVADVVAYIKTEFGN